MVTERNRFEEMYKVLCLAIATTIGDFHGARMAPETKDFLTNKVVNFKSDLFPSLGKVEEKTIWAGQGQRFEDRRSLNVYSEVKDSDFEVAGTSWDSKVSEGRRMRHLGYRHAYCKLATKSIVDRSDCYPATVIVRLPAVKVLQ